MSNPCEHWEALLTDLLISSGNAKISALSAEEAGAVRQHVVSCDKCMDDIPKRVLLNQPEEDVLRFLETLEEFMEGEVSTAVLVASQGQQEEPGSKSVTKELHLVFEAERQSLEATVASFIAKHPELNFGSFFLPSALSPLAAFKAADATAMLLRRNGRRDEERFSFQMFPDGSFQAIGKNNRIPASSVISEIGRCLWESPRNYFVPSNPNINPQEEYKEFRRRHQDDRGRDTIVPCLLAWLFAALKVSPGLMYGYRARPSDTDEELILEPFKKGEPINNEDKDKPWMV